MHNELDSHLHGQSTTKAYIKDHVIIHKSTTAKFECFVIDLNAYFDTHPMNHNHCCKTEIMNFTTSHTRNKVVPLHCWSKTKVGSDISLICILCSYLPLKTDLIQINLVPYKSVLPFATVVRCNLHFFTIYLLLPIVSFCA